MKNPWRFEGVEQRIHQALSAKIGEEAANLEFRVYVTDVWHAGTLLVLVTTAILSIALRNWVIGCLAIASCAWTIGVTIRRFQLRHRFFLAVSDFLDCPVSWRHPVHGLPNWRKNLSDEKLAQLEEKYDHWCIDRNLTPRRDPRR